MDLPIDLNLPNGTTARVTRIGTTDLGYDLGSGTGDEFVSTDSAKSAAWTPGEEEPTEAELIAAIVAPAPASVRRAETRTILDRLTTDEQAALLLSDVPAVRVMVAKATATGVIQDNDPDFPVAVAGLDALGIIAANRWDALLA